MINQFSLAVSYKQWMHCSEAAIPESNTDFPMLNRYSIQDLEAFTDNFNGKNLIGITQFGQVYRGKIVETGKETRTVTVKTLKESPPWYLYHDEIGVLLNVFIRSELFSFCSYFPFSY